MVLHCIFIVLPRVVLTYSYIVSQRVTLFKLYFVALYYILSHAIACDCISLHVIGYFCMFLRAFLHPFACYCILLHDFDYITNLESWWMLYYACVHSHNHLSADVEEAIWKPRRGSLLQEWFMSHDIIARSFPKASQLPWPRQKHEHKRTNRLWCGWRKTGTATP